jgi:two-component system, NarL family, nitrate/nitrite response regulator NarL
MSRADEISSTFLVVFRQAELLAKERGTGQMSSISVALIDDHPLMLDAISSLLRRTEGFEIVGTGATPLDVVEICKNSRPDIVIIEPLLAGDPYTAISNALKISPLTRILAYTGATGVEPAIRALDAGARGYVLKRSNVAELIQGVSSVHAGETYITQSFASRVIGGLRDASLRRKAAEAVVLNIREQQIVRLLMAGKTNKEIARAIGISEKMVKHYMTGLMQKLQVRNRLEVVIAAQRFGEHQAETRLLS